MSHNYDKTAQFTDEKAKAKAASLGCSVEYSDDNTLQIDYDKATVTADWWDQFDMLRELNLVDAAEDPTFRRSKSGRLHITVKLRSRASVRERIMLQALLHSDPKREALCLASLDAGQMANPILFFRPTGEVKVTRGGDTGDFLDTLL